MGHQLTDDRSRISVAFGGTLGRQVPRFLIFSGLSTVVALVTGYLLYQVLGFGQAWRYGVSVGVSALVGMVVSFALNRRYTFARSGRPIGDEMRTFLIVALGGLALTVGLSTLFRDWLLPWLTDLWLPEAWRNTLNLELIAHTGAVALVAFYSFLGHKYLSFGLGIRHRLKRNGTVVPCNEDRSSMEPETPVRTDTANAIWPVLIAMPLIFLIFVLIQSARLPADEVLKFRDTDDAMRMVQVLDLKDGADWYDLTQRRLNPPDGVPMHWSRLPDLPLLAIVTLTEPLLGRTAAVNLAATLIPPLLWVGFFAAFVWAATPLIERSVRPMAGLICLALLVPHGYFMPLRVDHHGWQLLLAMIGAGTLIRAALGSGLTLPLILAGTAGALGLWIGAEAIPPIALLALGLTLLWLAQGDRAWTLVLYGAVLTGGVLLIYPLALEPANWGSTNCDAFSAVSLGLAGAVLVFGLGLLILERRPAPRLTSPKTRLLSAGLLGGGLLLVLWALFPECARGPYGALSPEAQTLVDQVVEARSMPTVIADQPRTAALFMALPLAALILVLWRLLTVERTERRLWWILLLLVLGGLTLQFWQLRTSALANAYAGLALTWWAGDWARRASASRHRPTRVGLLALPVLVILGLPILLPTLVESATGKPESLEAHKCDLSSVIPVLNGPELTASGPALIAAHVNVGPALLLRTPHQVLAAPYHRNTGGLRANTDIFGPDEALSRRVIAERGVDLLYVCGEPKPEQPPQPQPTPEPAPEATDPTHPTLYQRLQTGAAPEWLEPIPIPDAQPGEALYRVR